MIALFLGVSSVGKTSIMEVLAESYGWRWLPVHMSRGVRRGEYAKTKVSPESIEKGKQSGSYLWINKVHGNTYATPKKPVLEAERADSLFMLDFPIESEKEAFGNVNHLNVIVMPESVAQLKKQANQSNRSERLPEILRSYEQHYSRYSHFDGPIEHIDKKNMVVVNYADRVESTAELINDSVG